MKKPWLDDEIASNGLPVQENFARWFAQSKVVDQYDNPLVLYHGTSRMFSAFDLARSGENFDAGSGAFFFSADEAVAEQIAAYAAENDESGDEISPRVISVYLSLQNPLVMDFRNHRRINIAKVVNQAKANGHDGVIALHARDDMPSWRETQYIAFRPEQIKSADANCGLYLKDSACLTDHEAHHALVRARIAKAEVDSSAAPEFLRLAGAAS